MQTPTREEMIRMAEETKKKNKQPEVTEEMMAEFPVKMEEWTIPSEEGDIKAYYSEPEQMQNPDVLILNLHGGGFIRSRTENDELFCRRMNHALSCKVLDVDYKIAPYYPFPVALHETFSVLRWIYANAKKLEIDPQKLVIMGHSAGGNLAIGAVMRALEEDMRTPALLISEYPPLDIYTDPEAKKPMGKGIPVERARLYNLFYCDREQQKDPYCSPVYAPNEMLRGFPPSLFLTLVPTICAMKRRTLLCALRAAETRSPSSASRTPSMPSPSNALPGMKKPAIWSAALSAAGSR